MRSYYVLLEAGQGFETGEPFCCSCGSFDLGRNGERQVGTVYADGSRDTRHRFTCRECDADLDLWLYADGDVRRYSSSLPYGQSY